MKHTIRRIGVVGNYLPRKCGLATFTTDVCESIAKAYPDIDVQAVAMNDVPEGYDYPERVRYEIDRQDPLSYKRAVEYLNQHDVDVVSLQHEYGIFGGPDGSHIVPFLRQLRAPIVPTLHTILEKPSEGQRHVLREIVKLSDRVIVMSERGAQFLRDIYDTPAHKIDFIHHGIPDVPFIDPNFHKEKFGVAGKTVLLTFGLLSPNKGIEYMIRALPEIVAEFPDVVYLVLGATHPHLLKQEGEKYRESLQDLAESLGVSDHVVFHNRFVETDELCEYITAADVYLTPYLNEAQITSGTLAYATGSGKAVISTPYWYAQELLDNGRGLLVPFRDADALAEATIHVLGDESARHKMRKSAYELGRTMVWSHVAKRMVETFEHAIEDRARAPRPLSPKTMQSWKPDRLIPPIKLTHLRHLTDGTGILQHATFNVPNYDEGYCTDDNARALVLAAAIEALPKYLPRVDGRNAARYMAFLQHAFDPKTGRFRNFMGYDRRWLEDIGSEDSHGRAVWALGAVVGSEASPRLQELAGRLFRDAAPAVERFQSPRSFAFALLGLRDYTRRFEGDRAMANVAHSLATRLLAMYTEHATDEWPWFEDILAYANAKLPHALIAMGVHFENDAMIAAGERGLHWLMEVQRSKEGYFAPIGTEGWYPRGDKRADFDQQPIEAHASVSACLEAYRATADERWADEAWLAFEWFLGHNALGVPIYDPATGACYDGLHAYGINKNQGAESLLAYLLAQVEMAAAFPERLTREREPSGAAIVHEAHAPRVLKPPFQTSQS